MHPNSTSDRFTEVYGRDDVAYGDRPSPELSHYLRQQRQGRRALDLGAGAGRDTLAMAKAGFDVVAVDSCHEGLARLVERVEEAGLDAQVAVQADDVRAVVPASPPFDLIVATTILDHIPVDDGKRLWTRMLAWLATTGTLYVEVHTTDDPGAAEGHGADSDAPVSETADQIRHYFAPGELLQWAVEAADLRVIRYEERLEWDYTHGPVHQHGKAILIATRHACPPMWYGAPPAFPRR